MAMRPAAALLDGTIMEEHLMTEKNVYSNLNEKIKKSAVILKYLRKYVNMENY